MTREQAIAVSYGTEIHFGECKRTIGPRGGVKEKITRVRVNGKCRTWKTRPTDFELPMKYGLRDHFYINPYNASSYHLASECPLCK